MKRKIVFSLILGVLLALIICAAIFITFYNKSKVKPTLPNKQPITQQEQIDKKEQTNNKITQIKKEIYTAYGRFVGLVDAHSAEFTLINTKFDYSVFEISDKIINNKSLSEGILVEISFYKNENGGNPIISDLKLPESISLQGIFVGQADNNFSEFIFDNKHVVLQIPENIQEKIANLNTNSKVLCTITNNSQNPKANLILNDIKY
ncbi:hypothetical protein ACAG39_04510 [Caldicellulosiruptoraceae bacterium PP1]